VAGHIRVHAPLLRLQRRSGFTLIELLTVVVIIAILASAAIVRYSLIREKAHIATMKANLHSLLLAEEAYFADSVKYSATVTCANPPTPGTVAFCTTTGNTLAGPTVGTGTQAGWTASITNVNTTKSCGIYIGAVTPAAPATAADPEGTPVCQ
jgi:type IV pilus assembly protein PilE